MCYLSTKRRKLLPFISPLSTEIFFMYSAGVLRQKHGHTHWYFVQGGSPGIKRLKFFTPSSYRF